MEEITIQHEPSQQDLDMEKQKIESDTEEVNELLNIAIDDASYREKARELLSKVDRRLGIWVLEDPNHWTQGNLLEEIIHYMRWEPHWLFDCPINKLHEYEMVLAAHITFVKARENHWQSMVKIANRDLRRAKKLASNHCSGKSVGEREALAMTRFPKLGEIEKELDTYNMYREKCDGISETLVQMDNSLKKTLERRKFEYERNTKGNN
jgi:hypothetical protein